jgi:hypothetical protein
MNANKEAPLILSLFYVFPFWAKTNRKFPAGKMCEHKANLNRLITTLQTFKRTIAL